MTQKHMKTWLIIILVIFTGTIVIAPQVWGLKFTASMYGSQIEPATDTTVNGTASFRTMTNNTMIKYKIQIEGSSDVTAADIRLSNHGENGVKVVDLLEDSKKNGIKQATSIRGNITSSSLEGPLKTKQLTELISAMKNGSAYLNIDTPYHEKGQIKGKITSTDNINSSQIE